MILSRFQGAARKAKAETAIRKVLSAKGLDGDVILRELDDALSASVLLKGDPPGLNVSELESALAQESGLSRVVVVTSAHGEAAPAKPQAPAGGGHSDPLRLGSRPAQRLEPQRPFGVTSVIAVASGKGGVGKSTVSAGLALELSRRGKTVGILDLDIHGPSLPVLFPIETRLKADDGKIIPAEAEGLKLVSIGYMVDERKAVAWRGPMVMNAARQLIDDTAWGQLDVLIVDTPPGTGDAHLSLLQRLKLDGALLVATPSPLAAADVRRGAELFRKVGTPIMGVVLNMTGGPLGDDIDQNLLAELDLEVIERLPLAIETAQVPLSAQAGVSLPAATEAVEAKLRSLAT
ncbi:MAG: P-loop NTPase [Pseudomonadota bacterium]